MPELKIRFHGRGGQGTVLAAKIVADAVARAGRGHCMAIPEFGVERRGAPVTAYARVSERPVRERSRLYRVDAVVLFDPSLAESVPVVEGLRAGGLLLVNSAREPAELSSRWPAFRVIALPARKLALARRLGPAAAPLVNTAMAGALCAVLELADRDSLEEAVRAAVPAKPEQNADAAVEAFDFCRSEAPHAPA